jgi:hypothetical protein
MTDDFENQLRRVLRPVDAPAGFSDRLLKRLPARETPVVLRLPVSPQTRSPARRFGVPAALAASLVMAVVLGQWFARERDQRLAQQRMELEEAAGRAASREIMQALRVTSQKLDLAYEAVNTPPENRS